MKIPRFLAPAPCTWLAPILDAARTLEEKRREMNAVNYQRNRTRIMRRNRERARGLSHSHAKTKRKKS